jgi:hypothetical protein
MFGYYVDIEAYIQRAIYSPAFLIILKGKAGWRIA